MSFFIFLAVTSVIQMLVGAVVQKVCPELTVLHPGIYMMFAMLPIYVIGYPLLVALTKRKEKVSLEDHKLGSGNFMVILMMCFCAMVIGNFVGLIVNLIIGFIKGTPIVNPLEVMLPGNSIWVNIFIVGICAPIFEELMFRKILVDRMLRYGEAAAVVVSGLMFGLFHGNFSQFFYAMALGCLFAYVYAKTGRLRYPIILHMIINLSSSFMLPVMQRIDMSKLSDPQALMEMIVPVSILVVYELAVYGMGIAGLILFIVRRKHFVFKQGSVVLTKGKKASVLFGNAGMILFILGCASLFVMTLAI